jgi:hypothetical protein
VLIHHLRLLIVCLMMQRLERKFGLHRMHRRAPSFIVRKPDLGERDRGPDRSVLRGLSLEETTAAAAKTEEGDQRFHEVEVDSNG